MLNMSASVTSQNGRGRDRSRGSRVRGHELSQGVANREGNPEHAVYTCGLCRKLFDSVIGLSKHMEQRSCQKQSEATEYVCKICNKQFSNGLQYHQHLKLQTCARSHLLIQMKETSDRQVVQNNQPPPEYVCGTCLESFYDPSQLESHITNKLCVRRMQAEFVCGACQKTFTQQSDLESHMESCQQVHMKENRQPTVTTQKPVESLPCSFECGICKNSFSSNTELENHMVSRVCIHLTDSLSTDEFHCGVCKKVFRSDKTLQEHIEQGCFQASKDHAPNSKLENPVSSGAVKYGQIYKELSATKMSQTVPMPGIPTPSLPQYAVFSSVISTPGILSVTAQVPGMLHTETSAPVILHGIPASGFLSPQTSIVMGILPDRQPFPNRSAQMQTVCAAQMGNPFNVGYRVPFSASNLESQASVRKNLSQRLSTPYQQCTSIPRCHSNLDQRIVSGPPVSVSAVTSYIYPVSSAERVANSSSVRAGDVTSKMTVSTSSVTYSSCTMSTNSYTPEIRPLTVSRQSTESLASLLEGKRSASTSRSVSINTVSVTGIGDNSFGERIPDVNGNHNTHNEIKNKGAVTNPTGFNVVENQASGVQTKTHSTSVASVLPSAITGVTQCALTAAKAQTIYTMSDHGISDMQSAVSKTTEFTGDLQDKVNESLCPESSYTNCPLPQVTSIQTARQNAPLLPHLDSTNETISLGQLSKTKGDQKQANANNTEEEISKDKLKMTQAYKETVLKRIKDYFVQNKHLIKPITNQRRGHPASESTRSSMSVQSDESWSVKTSMPVAVSSIKQEPLDPSCSSSCHSDTTFSTVSNTSVASSHSVTDSSPSAVVDMVMKVVLRKYFNSQRSTNSPDELSATTADTSAATIASTAVTASQSLPVTQSPMQTIQVHNGDPPNGKTSSGMSASATDRLGPFNPVITEACSDTRHSTPPPPILQPFSPSFNGNTEARDHDMRTANVSDMLLVGKYFKHASEVQDTDSCPSCSGESENIASSSDESCISYSELIQLARSRDVCVSLTRLSTETLQRFGCQQWMLQTATRRNDFEESDFDDQENDSEFSDCEGYEEISVTNEAGICGLNKERYGAATENGVTVKQEPDSSSSESDSSGLDDDIDWDEMEYSGKLTDRAKQVSAVGIPNENDKTIPKNTWYKDPFSETQEVRTVGDYVQAHGGKTSPAKQRKRDRLTPREKTKPQIKKIEVSPALTKKSIKSTKKRGKPRKSGKTQGSALTTNKDNESGIVRDVLALKDESSVHTVTNSSKHSVNKKALQYLCGVCEERFDTPEKLVSHLHTHTSSETEKGNKSVHITASVNIDLNEKRDSQHNHKTVDLRSTTDENHDTSKTNKSNTKQRGKGNGQVVVDIESSEAKSCSGKKRKIRLLSSSSEENEEIIGRKRKLKPLSSISDDEDDEDGDIIRSKRKARIMVYSSEESSGDELPVITRPRKIRRLNCEKAVEYDKVSPVQNLNKMNTNGNKENSEVHAAKKQRVDTSESAKKSHSEGPPQKTETETLKPYSSSEFIRTHMAKSSDKTRSGNSTERRLKTAESTEVLSNLKPLPESKHSVSCINEPLSKGTKPLAKPLLPHRETQRADYSRTKESVYSKGTLHKEHVVSSSNVMSVIHTSTREKDNSSKNKSTKKASQGNESEKDIKKSYLNGVKHFKGCSLKVLSPERETSHTKNTARKSTVCSKTSTQKKNGILQNSDFKCTSCSESFSTETELTAHAEIHKSISSENELQTGEDQRNCACGQCSKSFTSKSCMDYQHNHGEAKKQTDTNQPETITEVPATNTNSLKTEDSTEKSSNMSKLLKFKAKNRVFSWQKE